MGTKIQANAFLHGYHSVIDLNGSTSNGIRPIYNENQIVKNCQNPESFKNGYLGYDLEKVRQTILEHESIFRNQLQELHRLYGRQQELMNGIKRREMNKDDVKEEKSHLSSLFSLEEAKRKWNNGCHISSLHSMPGCLSKSGTNSKLFPSFLEDKSVPVFPSKSSIFRKGTNNRISSDLYSSNMETEERYFKLPGVENTSGKRNHLASCDGITKLSLVDVQTSQRNADASKFNLYTGLTLSRGEVSANPCSSFNLATKDFFQNSSNGANRENSSGILGLRNGRSGREHLFDDFAEKKRFDKHSSAEDFCSGKSRASPQSLLAEPRKELSNCPYMGTSVSRRKKKIFGVEISEGNDDPFNAASNKSSTLDPKSGPHQENRRAVSFKSSPWVANSCMQTHVNDGKNETSMADSHSNRENPRGVLPWFLKNSQVSGDLSKRNNNSYFMNLDSLQNCSQKFFRKAEIAKDSFPTSKQKKEISAPMDAHDAEGGVNEVNDASAKKIIGGFRAKKVEMDEKFLTNQLETENIALHKGLNNYIADLRHHIDLNLSLDEEDALSAPSLPTAVVKIATTEIDLEVPAVIEPETNVSPEKVNSTKIDVSYEECDKTAAEAMIAISLSAKKNLADDANRLKWFADIISSQCGGTDRSGAPEEEEESIPDGMDDFEFMTLKLEDTKEEQHCYEPFASKNPSDDETGAKLSKMSRRGQSRRGRQKRDFQRDILPGLVTLSRVEVTEDFQTFEELTKGVGSTRSSRGRKRLGGRITSPKTKALRSTRAKQPPVCQLEERSLSGWGKRTRRLPRQRCANAFISFPVKC